MKTIKLILAVSIVLLLCTSCEKDENGNRITYYKNKTGEGYVFYKFKNDSIAPIINAKSSIESYTVEMFSTTTKHVDFVYTDNNGKYSVKFARRINGHIVRGYWIFSSPGHGRYPSSGSIYLNNSILNDYSTIFLDTIFYYPDEH